MSGVDVVVVNFHNDALLSDFVESYYAHRFGSSTITAVYVERSPDTLPGPSDMPIKTMTGKENVYSSENIGYGRACNRGARDGTNDVILLANADTLLTDGFEECYRALMAHDDWGILGPRQIDDHGRLTAGGILPMPQRPHVPLMRGFHEHDVGQHSEILEDVPMVSGALYFIKRKLWQELADCPKFQEVQPGSVGAFLETPHYFEDTFCSYHARAHGYKVVYYGPVTMVHLWHKASAIGGVADGHFTTSQSMHRRACQHHGILCE